MIRTMILPEVNVLPMGSRAVQWEDGALWTHGTTVGKGGHNHNDRSYTIHVTKTGLVITRNSKHVKPTEITAEQCLWDQLEKHSDRPCGRHSKTNWKTNTHEPTKNNLKTLKMELLQVTNNKKPWQQIPQTLVEQEDEQWTKRKCK